MLMPRKVKHRKAFRGRLKGRSKGEKGHIAISTNHIHRAVAYLKRKGISTVPETEKETEGKARIIYLDQEVSGFALHLHEK